MTIAISRARDSHAATTLRRAIALGATAIMSIAALSFSAAPARASEDVAPVAAEDAGSATYDVQNGVDGPTGPNLGEPSGNPATASERFIRGTVQLPAGATMDGWIDVYVKGTGEYLGFVEPAVGGYFEIYPGSAAVRLHFYGFSGAAAEWYDNKSTWPQADGVTATFSGKSVGTVKLAAGATISGDLPTEVFGGAWGEDICVTAWNWSNSFFESATCGPRGGSYTLDFLQAGSYLLEFEGSDSGDEYYPYKVTVSTGADTWLQLGTMIASLDADFYPHGADMELTLATGNDASGTAKIQTWNGSKWSDPKWPFAVEEGVGITEIPFLEGVEYRVAFGRTVSNVMSPPTYTTFPVLTGPEVYYSNAPFELELELDAPGNGVAVLKQRVNGGSWSTVSGGIQVVDGVGSRTMKRESGDVVEYYARFYGGTSGIVLIDRATRDFENGGGGDYFKGTTHEIGWLVSPAFTGTTNLWVKKGSNSWEKTKTKVTFVDGEGSIVVKPGASTTQYQVRFGLDRPDPIVFTRVAPTLTLEFDEGDDGTHEIGSSFDINISIAGPEGSDVDPYTGKVKLQVRKPGGSWSTVSGGIDVVEGEGSRTLTQPTGKREYRVIFAGKKSNVIRATGVLPPL